MSDTLLCLFNTRWCPEEATSQSSSNNGMEVIVPEFCRFRYRAKYSCLMNWWTCFPKYQFSWCDVRMMSFFFSKAWFMFNHFQRSVVVIKLINWAELKRLVAIYQTKCIWLTGPWSQITVIINQQCLMQGQYFHIWWHEIDFTLTESRNVLSYNGVVEYKKNSLKHVNEHTVTMITMLSLWMKET